MTRPPIKPLPPYMTTHRAVDEGLFTKERVARAHFRAVGKFTRRGRDLVMATSDLLDSLETSTVSADETGGPVITPRAMTADEILGRAGLRRTG